MQKNRLCNTDFEELYRTYYSRMKRFAQEYVIREEDAENITQDVFLELWESDTLLSSHTNLFSFLFTAIKNRCMDFLRHQSVAQKAASKLQKDYQKILQMKFQSLEVFDVNIFAEPDIESIVQSAISELPEKCREIFIMNKIDGKKQKDIASELNISVNTVETQMGIAYKKLREQLKDYIPLLLFLLN